MRIQEPEQHWLGSFWVSTSSSRTISWHSNSFQVQEEFWPPLSLAPPPSLWVSYRFLPQPSQPLPCLAMAWWPGRCPSAFPGFHSFPQTHLQHESGRPGPAWRPGVAAKLFSKPCTSGGRNLGKSRAGSRETHLACGMGRWQTEKG